MVGADGNPIRFDGLQSMTVAMMPDDDVDAKAFGLPRDFCGTGYFRLARMSRKRFIRALMSRGASKKDAKRTARRTKIPYGDAYARMLFYGIIE